MKNIYRALGALFMIAFSLPSTVLSPSATAAAEEEVALEQVLVTASRIEEPRETVGSSVTIIDRAEIEESGAFFLKELLAGAPGLTLVSDGPPGQRTSVFTRGTHSGATLFMINGIRVREPIVSSAEFTAHLPVENIERVEIIRGPQSTLYGSDAMGGVINIITRKGEGTPRLRTSLTGGSFGTWNPAFNYGGRTGPLSFSLGASLYETDGISIAQDGAPDAYRREAIDGRLAWDAAENLDLDFGFQYWKADFDMDDWDWMLGVPVEDPDLGGASRFFASRVGATFFTGEKWEHQLGAGFQEINRHYRNPGGEETLYSGDSLNFDWQQSYRFSDSHLLVGGLSRQEERGEINDSVWDDFERQKSSLDGAYLQYRAAAGPLTTTLGGRLDRHSEFGSHHTWRATSSWEIAEGTRLRASYGTGFRAPSLTELYHAPWGGNPALDPEESRGWDAGISRAFGRAGSKVRLEAAWFENRIKNEITGDPVTWVYENIARTESSGLEMSASGEAGPFSGQLNYTFLRAFNQDGERLLRRPKHEWNLRAGWRLHERARLSAVVNRTENRLDVGPVKMDNYTTCDLAFEYRASETLSAGVKVSNLFDEDYQQVLGYETPGRAFYLTLEQNW